MSRSFDLGNKIRKQKNGIATPPNEMARIAPPEWKNFKLITATTSTEVVPQNVYQIKVMVWGAGGTGTPNPSSGGGGGYAEAIVDVVPGQTLPTITVGVANGASSSFGSLISATGGNTTLAGTGTVSSGLRGGFTASGGAGVSSSNGGAASGSPYGDGGGNAAVGSQGGCGWAGAKAVSLNGATCPYSTFAITDGILDVINKRGTTGTGATSATTQAGIGCGAFAQADASVCFPAGFGAGGAYGSTKGSNGGLAGGGGGGSGSQGGQGGAGLVILAWTEGY